METEGSALLEGDGAADASTELLGDTPDALGGADANADAPALPLPVGDAEAEAVDDDETVRAALLDEVGVRVADRVGEGVRVLDEDDVGVKLPESVAAGVAPISAAVAARPRDRGVEVSGTRVLRRVVGVREEKMHPPTHCRRGARSWRTSRTWGWSSGRRARRARASPPPA